MRSELVIHGFFWQKRFKVFISYSSGRPNYEASDRSSERPTEWSSDRAIERSGDRTIERSSDRKQIINQAPDSVLTRWLVRCIELFKIRISCVLMMFKSTQIQLCFRSRGLSTKMKPRFSKSFAARKALKKPQSNIFQDFRRPQGPATNYNRGPVCIIEWSNKPFLLG